MRYVLVTPPTDTPVSIAEAKAHCRVDASDDDDLFAIYIAAATANLDGYSGILGRALITQSWRIDTDAPDDDDRIAIDMPGVASVASVKYVADGAEQTWSTDEWQLVPDGDLFAVEPKDGYSWPSADDREDAYRVTFTAGYGSAGSSVPAPIRAAILLMTADLYEHRESVVVGVAAVSNPVELTVTRLVAPYRIVRI